MAGGTTFAWTRDYLSKVSPEWKTLVGASGSPKWPVGIGAEGNEGVARAVRDTPGSIGYVEYIYAITEHMTYGSVRNSAGRFVSPDLESIFAAARGSANRIAEDFQTSISNAPGVDDVSHCILHVVCGAGASRRSAKETGAEGIPAMDARAGPESGCGAGLCVYCAGSAAAGAAYVGTVLGPSQGNYVPLDRGVIGQVMMLAHASSSTVSVFRDELLHPAGKGAASPGFSSRS